MPDATQLLCGYQPDFMGPGLSVPLPRIVQGHPAGHSKQFDYLHFSVVASKNRRFPYFSATNIDGGQFRQLERKDDWREDPNAVGWQWGSALYTARQSTFDRGHMTKREDPQWGATDEIAAQAANETFFYTNAVPQMEILNRRTNAWRGLEDYILHDEARRQKGRAATAAEPGLLLNVFTGPVLALTDPFFVTSVAGRKVQVPELFWKVVYYTNDGLELRRVGFLMGQHQALKHAGLVEVQMVESFEKYTLLEGLFEDYRDAEPYQSGVRFIEDRTGLVFPKAVEVYADKKPNPLKYEAG